MMVMLEFSSIVGKTSPSMKSLSVCKSAYEVRKPCPTHRSSTAAHTVYIWGQYFDAACQVQKNRQQLHTMMACGTTWDRSTGLRKGLDSACSIVRLAASSNSAKAELVGANSVAGADKFDSVSLKPDDCKYVYRELKSLFLAISESLRNEHPGKLMVPLDCFSCRPARAGATNAAQTTRAATVKRMA